MDFASAKRLFDTDRIQDLASTSDGLRFLKLKSLSRREHLERVFAAVSAKASATTAATLLREAYDSRAISNQTIDSLIRAIYAEQRRERKQHEPELVSHLYRLQAFDWGGLHQNSLEKTIVDNYVKKITSYDMLCDRIDNELQNSLRGYVLCSWYNHWTSIIIEDVFRDHPRVLPAIGQTKKIDFFIEGVPFDLKGTYFPEGYVKNARRGQGLRPELTLLKQAARRRQIHFDDTLPEARLLEDLWAKLRDDPHAESQKRIAELRQFRIGLVQQAQADASELIRWLYENQGVRRFDASNRLFLVLIDQTSFFDSWKLKRAKPLLDVGITRYLDGVSRTPGRRLTFTWEGSRYEVVADAALLIHT